MAAATDEGPTFPAPVLPQPHNPGLQWEKEQDYMQVPGAGPTLPPESVCPQLQVRAQWGALFKHPGLSF